MDEIKQLLASWESDEYINRGGLESAHNAIILLIAKVESLENEIEALKNGNK